MAAEDETKTENQPAAAAAAESTKHNPVEIGPGDVKTREQLDREKQQKRIDLQQQLAELDDKPTPIEDLSNEELSVALWDELVTHLGSHPRLEALWIELRSRIAPPPDGEKKAA